MKKGILLALMAAFLSITINAQVQNQTKIVSSERTIDAAFGSAVELFMDYAVVGEPHNDTDENSENTLEAAGAVFIYKKILKVTGLILKSWLLQTAS